MKNVFFGIVFLLVCGCGDEPEFITGDSETETYFSKDTDTDTETYFSKDTDTDTETYFSEDTDTRVAKNAGGEWALDDRDGERVLAVVEPSSSDPAKRFSDLDFDCVHVIYFGNTYIDMIFNLFTGRAEDCQEAYPTFLSMDAIIGSLRFLDDTCEGLTFHTAQNFLFIAGSKMYFSGSESYGENNILYEWREDKCIAANESTPVYLIKEVPDYILFLLDNPPYTLELEY